MTHSHNTTISRRQLMHAGLGAGIAALLSSSGPASAALTQEAPPDPGDLGLARLGATAELIAANFYQRAIASKKFDAREVTQLRLALANERQHYQAIAQVFAGTDESPPTTSDFVVAFPSKDFRSRVSIAHLGTVIEKAVIGVHLGSVAAYTSAEHRLTAARIAASDARHMALLSTWVSDRPIGVALPNYLDTETAAEVLSRYLT